MGILFGLVNLIFLFVSIGFIAFIVWGVIKFVNFLDVAKDALKIYIQKNKTEL